MGTEARHIVLIPLHDGAHGARGKVRHRGHEGPGLRPVLGVSPLDHRQRFS
ncbi:hypothetical protein GCM10009787_17830 [Streptomyces bangladeshensis]|uniref:Uncharacterized protein n=1 Tax=Streptomyces bangladeshensis TaxID=295352 RepID=A0ABP5N5Q7_9ACTN